MDAVKRLLTAYELKQDGLSEFEVHKKHIEMLITIVEEKKKKATEL